MIGANAIVTFRAKRGGRNRFARDVEVMIYPAAHDSKVVGDVASGYQYGMHWDPDEVVLDDGGAIATDTLLLWSRFPNQDIQLRSITYSEGAFVMPTAYFMPINTGQ